LNPQITLGNELPNNLSPAVTAIDFAAFAQLLRESNATPQLLGTDAWWKNQSWVRDLLTHPELPELGAFTFHLCVRSLTVNLGPQWSPTVSIPDVVKTVDPPPPNRYLLGEDISESRLLDPAVLDSAVTFANGYNAELARGGRAGLPLWITEAGAAWGGAIDTFGPA
jgi:hypothetical protein